LKSRHFLRVALLGALGVLLVWQVVTRSLVASLASAQPEAALALRATDSEALLRLAELHLDVLEARPSRKPSPPPSRASPEERSDGVSERLRIWAELAKGVEGAQRGSGGEEPAAKDAGSPEGSSVTPEDVSAWSARALSGDPLNARALRILGQVADTAGDEGRATSFMEAAAATSIRESVAVYWLMQKSYEKKDYDRALTFADALLRTRSQVLPYVLPTLAGIAENPVAKGRLEKLLATDPPWRRSFFSALPRAVKDARTPLQLLLAIRDAPTPPAAGDLRDYLNLLIEHKFYELAYYTWLQFLPPERLTKLGLLFNGSFESNPSGLPFDWVISPGTGVTMDIVERPDQAGRRALLMELGPGRVEFAGIAELVLLGPGSYRFKGKFKGEIAGRRGLVWRATCVGGAGAPIGESPMIKGPAPRWEDVEFSFTVPERECRAQRLRLELDARMASEQLVTGSMWFDELAISRVP
jgi:hypothetical protein